MNSNSNSGNSYNTNGNGTSTASDNVSPNSQNDNNYNSNNNGNATGGNDGDASGSSSQVRPYGNGKPKRPAPNEGPMGHFLYGGSGTTGFVIFMVIGVIIAIFGSALVTIGTSGRRSLVRDPLDDLTRIVLSYFDGVPKNW